MLRAREAVRTLKEYHPPLGNREGLRLDFNENTAGCSPRVLERLREIDGENLARYLVRIAEGAPDAAVLIDEAYFHFCGESAAPKWREVPNLFVSRTFSKVY